MAGTGLLALPKAMDQAGWFGLLATFALCVLSGYAGLKLGDCWSMLRKMNPNYSEGSRSPFQIIATEGAGRAGKYVQFNHTFSYLKLEIYFYRYILIFVIYFQLLGASCIHL